MRRGCHHDVQLDWLARVGVSVSRRINWSLTIELRGNTLLRLGAGGNLALLDGGFSFLQCLIVSIFTYTESNQ